MDSLKDIFDFTFDTIHQGKSDLSAELVPQEIGITTTVSTGIARVSGLPGVGYDELLKFPDENFGIAFNLDQDEIGVVLLGNFTNYQVGSEVRRTGRVIDVRVGDGLLGRVVNPLGKPMDDKGPIVWSKRLPLERPAVSIMDRSPVTVPLQTGIKVVDALIPVGRGQRELILGDRQTGKTSLAVDTILNQRDQNVICVYCAIGQRASSVAQTIATFRERGAMEYTIVVVTEGNDPPGLAYIAPYAATSMAEFFMEQGKDVLIVYDDLTHHARAYREISLLLRRPPGREAYPGDIFYIHSRLLERSTHLSPELGGGSLTALPIIETEAQNMATYIPTNLISITDGQIYLSPRLFEFGILPAVDVGKSVSRVGGQAQKKVYHSVSGNLKLAYAQFEELESFARFGTKLDENTVKIISHGQRIRECLKQAEGRPNTLAEQIIVLLALTGGLFDEVPLAHFSAAQEDIKKLSRELPVAIHKRIFEDDQWNDDDKSYILGEAKKILSSFYESNQEKTNE